MQLLPVDRRRVLLTVHRGGHVSAHDIASDLRMTVKAVRHQLEMLAEAGLVEVVGSAGQRGRPRHLYALTERAEGLLPGAATTLHWLSRALRDVGKDNPEAIQAVLERYMEMRAERVQSWIREHGEAPGDALLQVLEEDGFMPTMEELWGDAQVLTMHHCPWYWASDDIDVVCDTERRALERMLPESNVELREHRLQGHAKCSFLVRTRNAFSDAEQKE